MKRALLLSLRIAIEGQLNADGTVDHVFRHMLDVNAILRLQQCCKLVESI
jgi:hypothetical protein